MGEMGKREKENPSPVEGTGVKGGAFAEIRTPDQLIKSQLLYQLSYEGIKFGDAAKDKPSFPDCKPVTPKKRKFYGQPPKGERGRHGNALRLRKAF